MEQDGPGGVEIREGREINILYEEAEECMEVHDARISSHDIVLGTDRVEVSDFSA